MLRAETRERLRRLIRQIEERPPAPRPLIEVAPLASVPLGGAVRRETASGYCTYREVRYDLATHVVGRQPLASLQHATGQALELLAPAAEAGDAALEELIFLDIETTGLGGAGAIVFLVAIASVEGSTLLMRQYLAESPAEEAALLDALLTDVHRIAADPVLVTYNGRSFDAPFLDGRATLHRRRAGFESMRHLDVLTPARSCYRGLLPSCRLAEVEARILGVTRPSADVDGAEVPAWYFRFLRSGDMRYVAPIASHNLLDVLSLAALTGRLAAFAAEAEAPRGREALGFARHLARAHPQRAALALEQALADLDDGPARRESLWRLSLLHKRTQQFEAAVPLWWELAGEPGEWSIAAHEELAKFYEHRERDFARAAEVVTRVLERDWPQQYPPGQLTAWHPAFRYRLTRLESRIRRAGFGSAGQAP